MVFCASLYSVPTSTSRRYAFCQYRLVLFVLEHHVSRIVYTLVFGFPPIASIWLHISVVLSLLVSRISSYGCSVVLVFLDLLLDIWVVPNIWLL